MSQRISCLDEPPHLCELVGLLQQGSGVPAAWIGNTDLVGLFNGVCALSRLAQTYGQHQGELLQRYNEAFLNLPLEIEDDLRRVFHDTEMVIGPQSVQNAALVGKRAVVRDWSDDLRKRITDWSHEGTKLAEALGQPMPKSVRDLKVLLELVPYCRYEEKPLCSWFSEGMTRKVRSVLADLRRQVTRRIELRNALFQYYHESVLGIDLEGRLREYKDHYGTWLRFCKPGYYKLRKEVSGYTKEVKIKPVLPRDLHMALELRRLEAEVEAARAEREPLLGPWYCGYETDFVKVKRALVNAGEILTVPLDKRTGGFLGACSIGSETVGVEECATRLRTLIDVWEPSVQPLECLLEIRWMPGTSTALMDADFDALHVWNEDLRKAVSGLCDLLERIEPCRTVESLYSLADVLKDIATATLARNTLQAFEGESVRWREALGNRWSGLQTDWTDVKDAIGWAERILAVLGDARAAGPLVDIATGGGSKAPSLERLNAAKAHLAEPMNDLSRLFDLDRIDSYISRDASPNEVEETLRLRFQRQRVGSMSEEAILGVFDQLRRRIEEIRDWISFNQLRRRFEEQGLTELYNALLGLTGMEPTVMPKAAKRALLGTWLQWLYTREPMLANFRGMSHQSLVNEFRELDRKHRTLGFTRVIAEAERRKPSVAFEPTGERSILMREAAKKRRHWPLRRLFTNIPNLLFRVKPCLLMSPLSVSQFLDPEAIHFDAVIFDEASQVKPEDGITAVYRGNQLVVCGDNKQLPPTSFFDYETTDEDYDEDQEDEDPDEFKNLLDQCTTIGMRQLSLKWHYRSRHENLIAFSNNQFYANKLVTFPSPWQEGEGLGVDLVVVEDGVYRRGKEKDNPREADKVVELVKELLTTDPDGSVGVVALSISQAEAIENRIEILMNEQPELAAALDRDLLERFFVKNLENVQGDERDTIILSLGYGRDALGKLSMNFGPLSHTGGEKRLNVAITRARKRLILVSSLVAGDLKLSATSKDGVRQLYHYLSYAERGLEALEMHYEGAFGEYESPLEEDVAAVIRGMGYLLVPQVGCSDYRIDLGVSLPAQPGTFILGVECDGAMYHSGKTARDRDRLRQEVLENLGWRIHRIWSPDWTTSRQRETERLRNAIKEATVVLRARDSEEQAQANDSKEIPGASVQVHVRLEDPADIPSWVQTYTLSSPKPPPNLHLEFHDPEAQPHIRRMLLQVLAIEAPIHIELAAKRVAKAWEIARVGNRISGAVDKAVMGLQGDRLIRKKAGFLWLVNQQTALKVRKPDLLNVETQRPIKFIPPEEIEVALEGLVTEALSLAWIDVVTQTARVLGFDRTGDDVCHSIEKALKRLLKAGRLSESGDRIAVNVEGNKNS